jgi:oligoendopeptidase F
MALTELPTRSEVAPEHTWNAPSVFPSDVAWQAEYKRITDSLSDLQRFQGHLADSPTTLADAFEAMQTFASAIEKVMVYAGMLHSVDTSNQVWSAMSDQAQGLMARYSSTIAFFNPELLAIGADQLRQWIAQEARLAIYGHYVDNLLRQQAHVRSAEVEEALGLAQEPFAMSRNTYGLLTNADLTFKPATSSTGETRPVAQGSMVAFLLNPDRELRRTAWENYADAHLAFKNTLASNLLASVKQDVFGARVRRYGSSLEAALFADAIPVQVFHNLVNTVRSHLPTWHRYWSVRRRALGYDTLHPYDIGAPLTEDSPTVPYAQAVDWLCEGMRPLGDEYVNTLRRGLLQERWVDIYPNKGKRQGAFSWGVKGTYPFIMMSYVDTLSSMSTLTHETGHSMHSYYTWQSQPTIYSDYTSFVAEVASNFNQAMVRSYLLNTLSDPASQIAIIEEAMLNFHRYFFVMPILAQFEFAVHERVERGEGVTADDMIAILADLYAEGYGSEIVLDRERNGITWAQFGHLYRMYYTFQYATGIAGAHALAKRVLMGGPDAANDYLNFLKAGGSLYPLDALKLAGVDLSTPEPVERAFGVLADYVDRLERLLVSKDVA